MHQTFFKSDLPSRFDTKQAKAKAIEDRWEQCKRAVYKRDGYTCRCCGKAVDLRCLSLLTAPHPHHIQRRSKGRIDETWNVVTLCASDHDLVHTKRTLRIESNADDRLEFWSRDDDNRWYLLKRETAVRVVERD